MNNVNQTRSVPDCAVIIPCHNQGRFLRDCLDSVLAQTLLPREIIVIDDGSTAKEAREIQAAAGTTALVRVLRNEQARGLPAARNQGIAFATTTYILPLDADDKIAPGYIEKATHILSANPDIGIVGGDSLFFGARTGKTPFPTFSEWRMTVDNCIISAAVFRKADWTRAGGYCEEFKKGFEDWDFYLSLLDAGLEYFHLNEVVYYYRRHKYNMTDGLDRNPALKETIFARLQYRHAKFFEKHAQGAMRFLYLDRAKQRFFGKRPLIALNRKILRVYDAFRSHKTGFWIKNNSFAILTAVTFITIIFELCLSVAPENSLNEGPSTLNIELVRESDAQTSLTDSMIVFGLLPDGRRLPLACLNISQTNEMSLSIKPLGKNPEIDSGAEIWLLSRNGDRKGLFPRVKGELAGWQFNTEIWRQPSLLSINGSEGALELSIHDERAEFFLMRHSSSGFCEISSGKIKSKFDLYDPNRNSILTVTLLNKKIDFQSGPKSFKLNIPLPGEKIEKIGFLREEGTAWELLNPGVQGKRLTKMKNKDIYSIDTGGQNYWILLWPVVLLFILAVYCIKTGHKTRKPYYLYALLLSTTLVTILVMVFYPCIHNTDSFDQWRQAKQGDYHNWHPIGFTLLMGFCQKILYFGGENAQSALAAWLSGTFFWLSISILIGGLINNIRTALCALTFLIFYFPFWPYTVTLCKDLPFASGLLCFGACIIWYSRRWGRWTDIEYFLILLFVNMIMLLNRQTAWLVLLVCLPGVFLIMPKQIRLMRSGIFIAALFSAFVSSKILYLTTHTRNLGNLSNMYLAFDVVGTLSLAKADMDEIAGLKTSKLMGIDNMMTAINEYKPGDNINYLLFGEKSPFRRDLLLDSNCAIEDFFTVAMRHPGALLRHKFELHKVLWDRKADGNIWFAYETITDGQQAKNIFGHNISAGSKMPNINVALRKWLAKATHPDCIRQFFLRHIFIFMSMLGSIVMSMGVNRVKRGEAQFIHICWFLAWVAFSSWLPNALILPGPDWRYLLPTTGIGVIVIVCALFGAFENQKKGNNWHEFKSEGDN